MDLVDQNLTPQISSLPLSTPKREEQAPEQRVSSGSPLWLVWALCGRPPKVAYCQKKVTRHLTKYLCNILCNIVDQMSLKWCQ